MAEIGSEAGIDAHALAAPVASASVRLESTGVVNFAMQQHRVPLVGRVSITNHSPAEIVDARVVLRLANGDAQAWERVVARIGPGDTYNLTPDSFVLDGAKMSSRTEAERTDIQVVVSWGEDRIEHSTPVELLAFNQWPGARIAPELLAAFITPNHPAIADLLSAARPRLAELSGSDAFDGYQSGNRTRASHIAAACFDSVGRASIGYINPPASFENGGQKTRLADQVVRERLATCLDLSLLLAGMWEQAGLHALIVLLPNHAMPAVWTHDQSFDPAVIDEVARLRNHIELGSIIPIESTVLTHPNKLFAHAVAAAKSRLASTSEDVLILDIHAARKLGVRPLPLRFEQGIARIDEASLHTPGPLSSSPAVITTIETAERADRTSARPTRSSEESPNNRVERWKRKLLDLTLRNRLLNFRESGRVVTLSVPDLAKLEDGLADGQSFEILPQTSEDKEFLLKQLDSQRLHSTASEGPLGKKMLELYRLSRSSIEETGANLLHLALGNLVWYESESSEQVRRAPLILLPLTITRRSTGSGYQFSIALSEEPLRPNVTLLEKLRNEFAIDCAGLDEFPEDEKGIDVGVVLHRFREAIRATKRWEVEESASIGLFSFNKFLMWRDLQANSQRLRESRLVEHLMGSRSHQFEHEEFPDPSTLDDTSAPGDLLCTRDADSSQLAAVLAAHRGRTFVLQGPPGTGKSQTIANMIADAVANGKRVLFVAEKMAALSVVRRRLEQDGLGPSCLELHSAKASKKEVLDQLRKAVESGSTREPADWGNVCSELAANRTTLNAYVKELHLPRASGESLFRVLGRVAKLGDGPAAPCPTERPAEVTEGQLRGWREQITRLVNAAKLVAPLSAHPYRVVRRAEWGFSLPDQTREAIQRAERELRGLLESLRAWVLAIRPGSQAQELESLDPSAIRGLCSGAALLPTCTTPNAALLTGPDWDKAKAKLSEIVAGGRERDQRRSTLKTSVRPEWFDLDLLRCLDEAKRAIAKPPILRWFAARGVIKSVRHLLLNQKPRIESVIKHLEEAQAIKSLAAEIEKVSSATAKWLGESRWNGGDADWDAIERDIAWSDSYRAALASLGDDPRAEWLRTVLIAAATAQSPTATRFATAVIAAWQGWESAWRDLVRLLELDEEALNRIARSNPWFSSMGSQLTLWSTHIGSLNDWVTWRHTRNAATEAGLSRIVEFFEERGLRPDELLDAFERGFGNKWIPEVADSIDAIRRFNLGQHEGRLERFRQLDTLLIERTKQLVAARIAANAPTPSGAAVATSELGILRREMEKKRRHLPTRKLIEQLPNLLPRLKPCFLMSPLSVAQYLDTRLPRFDLVIFDEASQIPVWDAIGALARGDDAIVVGDSKQLPPTAFFSSIDGEEGEPEPEVVEDLESILQECEASAVPTMSLRWHYRSRHESLIAFSNHYYYNNLLHTFPSPDDRSETLGVTMRHVPNGVYDRGGSRQNRVEAEAVVHEVVRRLKLGKAHASIGIVTFGQPQQVLIEDLLDTVRRENPDIEPYFVDGPEPVFIKNLENVQGDERDTIIFSVGYGRDQVGKITINFGPINQSGGERRLNVAITRARQQLIVFSSIRAEDIDARRTSSVGVHHFKTFLDYAARGPRAISEAVELTRNREFDSGFERAVHDALVERGWRLDTQVGCAGFRIDLAVIHPDKPGRYVLGVECDGASYHSAQTARDRDRLRAAVLRGLGWRLARVWSTDWRIDRRRCIDAIEQTIESALLDSGGAGSPNQDQLPTREETPTAQTPPQAAPEARTEAQRDLFADQTASFPTYRAAQPQQRIPRDADIADPSFTQLAIECLHHIVRTEHPVVPGVAIRRLAGWFGIQRIREKTEQRLHHIVNLAIGQGLIVRSGGALWPQGVDPGAYDGFRVPGATESDQRDVEDIPLDERVAAARHVLGEHFGMPREDLERETARLFGAGRVTQRIQEALGEAVNALVSRGHAVESDGNIALPPP